MSARILLINPPIYDFTAYDFWMKPYGLLGVGGYLRGKANLELFDFMDRASLLIGNGEKLRQDDWGRGEFLSEPIEKPKIFHEIPRRYQRFGIPRKEFKKYLHDNEPFDFALIQTGMTYWYPGVKEVIDRFRAQSPTTKIVLGGFYATALPDHASGLGADIVIEGHNLGPLWDLLGIRGDTMQTPFWEGYGNLTAGVIKLSQGCPFNCSYCSVPKFGPAFSIRPLEEVLAEIEFLRKSKCENIAFYDDAILVQPEKTLVPLLETMIEKDLRLNFHTPNALHARLVTRGLAGLMTQAGFKTFYLGFESVSDKWHGETGSKVAADDLAFAIENLRSAGMNGNSITAYMVLGHPATESQELERSMRFVNSLGVRIMLADFSPVPGTPDGDRCGEWVNLSEPLAHNKTYFAYKRLGQVEVNRMKQLRRELNSTVGESS